MRPRSLAAVVERARGDGDWEHHLRDFLDAFYAADGDVARQAAFVADEPGLLGRPEADAFLGGAGEHLARRWGLPIPDWVRAEERYLATALFVPGDKALRGYLICVSPVSFRTRLIFTGPDPLQRARFPYHRGVITMPPEHGFPKG
ncbi:hypothetical protein [Methylobacterium sp.]|uniref:hypothetical protein n=1 Tax=Methylobacterium sp. TaxID=409 RepID=UPI003AFFB9B9